MKKLMGFILSVAMMSTMVMSTFAMADSDVSEGMETDKTIASAESGDEEIDIAEAATTDGGSSTDQVDGNVPEDETENEIVSDVKTDGTSDQVVAFVTRLYKTVLERDPDQNGLNYWVSHLKNGTETGADVVANFYISEEMNNKGLSNSKFVDLAYNGIMNRNPDSNGKGYWVNGLESGASYDYVASGFIGSQEFTDLCSSYGITRGSRTPSEARDKNIGITGFVSRLYTKALGRGYDVNGLNYWCQRLIDDPSRDNLINVAYDGFYHSEELNNLNLSNDEYIKRCYRTFLNREAEGEGFNYWKQLLDSEEKTRDDLVSDFAYSEEFNGIMASYGLGSDSAQSQEEQVEQPTDSESNSGNNNTENTEMQPDRIVYITPTGKKYHYDRECAGPNAIEKRFDELSSKYGPCGTCVLR